MEHESSPGVWTTAELEKNLLATRDFFVFDVRNEDEFESWKIEGREPLGMVNVPYYEMLEVDEFDDVVDTFQHYLEGHWIEKLPRDKPILAVCAKGDTSKFVAEALRRLQFDALNLDGGTAAWGDHYAVRTVHHSEQKTIFQISRPARGCLSYLMVSEGEAVVIDPLRHVQRYLDVLKDAGAGLILVLDTHAHADHISGGPELGQSANAPYYLHPYDGIHPIDVLPSTLSYEFVEDGLEFSVGSSMIRAIHIPGHTLGNVAYLVDDQFLASGDSIFIDSIARPDLGGKGETWAPLHWASLRKLMALPGETLVLPGHFSSLAEADSNGVFQSSLADLKQNNSGLIQAQKDDSQFVEYILSSLPKFPAEYVEIKRVNAGLKAVDESAAAELEIGKNVCALSETGDES